MSELNSHDNPWDFPAVPPRPSDTPPPPRVAVDLTADPESILGEQTEPLPVREREQPDGSAIFARINAALAGERKDSGEHVVIIREPASRFVAPAAAAAGDAALKATTQHEAQQEARPSDPTDDQPADAAPQPETESPSAEDRPSAPRHAAEEEPPAPDVPAPPPKEVAPPRELEVHYREPTDTFDRKLSEEDFVVIPGGDLDLQDLAVYEIAMTRIQQLHDRAERDGAQKRPTVLMANFGPAPKSCLLDVNNTNASWYDSSELSPTELLSLLDTDQLAQALASAAAAGSEDKRLAITYNYILTMVGRALEGKIHDAAGNTFVTPPTPQQMRDGVRILRNHRSHETKEIGRGDQPAVKAAIPVTSLDANRPLLEPLGQFLDLAISDQQRAPATARGRAVATPTAGSPNSTDKPSRRDMYRAHVISAATAPYGLRERADNSILPQALLPLIAAPPLKQRPDSVIPETVVPDLVILTGADRGERAAVQEVLKHCRARHIPVIMSIHTLNDEVAPLIHDAAYGVLPLSHPEAVVFSRILRATLRADVTSRSGGTHANQGSSTHSGNSVGWERSSLNARNGGGSTSADRSHGVTYDDGDGITVAEGPILRPHEVERARDVSPRGAPEPGIRPYEIIPISSGGVVYGGYDLASGERRRSYPLVPQRVELEVTAKIEAIRQRVEDPKPDVPMPGRPRQLSERALETPAQERSRLAARYEAERNGSIHGLAGILRRQFSWPQWLREEHRRQNPELNKRHIQQLLDGETTDDWDEWSRTDYETWREEHGV